MTLTAPVHTGQIACSHVTGLDCDLIVTRDIPKEDKQ
ncbi:MAG: hypothetical protein IJ246_01930 [Clostridia bacterium]|nr:hypothetical protein [Clostridia bacterium]